MFLQFLFFVWDRTSCTQGECRKRTTRCRSEFCFPKKELEDIFKFFFGGEKNKRIGIFCRQKSDVPFAWIIQLGVQCTRLLFLSERFC